MNIRVSRILNAIALVGLVVLAISVIPSFFNPEFEVINDASAPVLVTAVWRNNEIELSNILPGAAKKFAVNDEAALVFRVSYAQGRVIESEPIYFSSRTKVIATISNEGIEVRYDFET